MKGYILQVKDFHHTATQVWMREVSFCCLATEVYMQDQLGIWRIVSSFQAEYSCLSLGLYPPPSWAIPLSVTPLGPLSSEEAACHRQTLVTLCSLQNNA